jgi:hypothetical protein
MAWKLIPNPQRSKLAEQPRGGQGREKEKEAPDGEREKDLTNEREKGKKRRKSSRQPPDLGESERRLPWRSANFSPASPPSSSSGSSSCSSSSLVEVGLHAAALLQPSLWPVLQDLKKLDERK